MRGGPVVAFLAATAFLAAACSAAPPTSTPTPSPTPTPAYGLPPLALPADEAPHDFQVEWWYFNVHLEGVEGRPSRRYALHDVVFQLQEPRTGRTLYVRQIGLADAGAGTHASAERLRVAPRPEDGEPSGFSFDMGSWRMSGEGGERYRLRAGAGGVSYDLTLRASSRPLLHDEDGLVDFRRAGITYYFSRPRLEARGTLTAEDGETVAVRGVGWLDKQWGDFQPTAVGWDWASVQLADGTDLMLSRLFDSDRREVELYATLRRRGGSTRRLGRGDFDFEPLEGRWASPLSGTAYATRWRVRLPSEDLDFVLEPLVPESELVSSVLGVSYWESGVVARTQRGEEIGQGFVELNWPRATRP